jgi:peptidoglycan/LPS O-acetylase OafA/YrhL
MKTVNKTGHLAWFDAARGVASIIVLLDHAYYIFMNRPDAVSAVLSTAAKWAVYVFFLMSGFLITLSIRKNIERNSRFDVFKYATSRVLRIYPPLIGAIAVIAAVVFIINSAGLPSINLAGRESLNFDHGDIWTALEMRRGFGATNGSLWSLYIEGQIYLIVGGVAALLWSRNLVASLGGIVALWAGTKLASDIDFFLFYAGIWTLGAAMCLVFEKRFRISLTPPRCMTTAGGFSYSLYVVHFPLLLLAASLSGRTGIVGVPLIAAMVVSVVAVIAFAHVFSLVFERSLRFRLMHNQGQSIDRHTLAVERLDARLE